MGNAGGVQTGARPSGARPPLGPEVLPSAGPSAAEGPPPRDPAIVCRKASLAKQHSLPGGFTLPGFCPAAQASHTSLLSQTFPSSNAANQAASPASRGRRRGPRAPGPGGRRGRGRVHSSRDGPGSGRKVMRSSECYKAKKNKKRWNPNTLSSWCRTFKELLLSFKCSCVSALL